MKKSIKTKALPTTPPAGEPSRAARRGHASLLKPKPKGAAGTRGLTPAGDPDTGALQSTLAPGPAQGTIKLEVSTMSPLALFTALTNLDEGLVETLFYPNFPEAVRTLITTSKDGLRAAIDNVAAGEAWLRTLRAAQDIEVNNARNSLRTGATTCESIDRSDEALVSVGWPLRRSPGRPRPVPAPARLTLKNTLHEGQAEARWPRVQNTHFYEVKAYVNPLGDNPDLIPWDVLPIIPVGPASLLFKDQPVGAWLTVRVRAVGAKGPSPWTEATTVRIN